MDISLSLVILTTVMMVSADIPAILITGGDPLPEVGLSVEMFLLETGENCLLKSLPARYGARHHHSMEDRYLCGGEDDNGSSATSCLYIGKKKSIPSSYLGFYPPKICNQNLGF